MQPWNNGPHLVATTIFAGQTIHFICTVAMEDDDSSMVFIQVRKDPWNVPNPEVIAEGVIHQETDYTVQPPVRIPLMTTATKKISKLNSDLKEYFRGVDPQSEWDHVFEYLQSLEWQPSTQTGTPVLKPKA